MVKPLEIALAIVSAVFVLYTAMIDPKASLIVAGVAIVCLTVYHMMIDKKETKKVMPLKKMVVKKTVKKLAKSKKK